MNYKSSLLPINREAARRNRNIFRNIAAQYTVNVTEMCNDAQHIIILLLLTATITAQSHTLHVHQISSTVQYFTGQTVVLSTNPTCARTVIKFLFKWTASYKAKRIASLVLWKKENTLASNVQDRPAKMQHLTFR